MGFIDLSHRIRGRILLVIGIIIRIFVFSCILAEIIEVELMTLMVFIGFLRCLILIFCTVYA